MSRYELNNINNFVMKAAKALYDNEKFLVGVLAVRARKLAQAYPTDPTVVGCSNFLNKRANSNADWISRAELKNVYSRLYSNNNKFATEFKGELGLVEHDPRTLMQRDPNEGKNLVADAYKELSDGLLSEQIEAALDKKTEFKLYSSAMAKEVQKTCARELNGFGIFPKKLAVVAGQSDILICQATYETPKGQSSVLIPVEIKEGRALMPNMFLSVGGFISLNKETLQEHLRATAGRSFQVDVHKLLEKISEAKNGTPKVLNDVEQAVIKMASSRQTPVNQTLNAVIMQEVDAASPNVVTPILEAPEEVKTMAAMLTSNAGAAEFTFGKDAVTLGRGLISNELRAAGFVNAQVAVADNTNDTISYAVAVDGKFGFTVPVKVSGGQLHLPKVIVSEGRLFDMSASGLSSLLSEGDTDSRAVAMTSPVYGAKPSELVDRVREAMASENFLAAEDALHVLKDSGDEVAYKAAMGLYVSGLKGTPDVAKHTCTATVKLPSSKYLLCSHTGLPVHQVHTDKYGNCQRAYRKDMSQSSEGGISTITSRIYFE